jgi:hypothetical protein
MIDKPESKLNLVRYPVGWITEFLANGRDDWDLLAE